MLKHWHHRSARPALLPISVSTIGARELKPMIPKFKLSSSILCFFQFPYVRTAADTFWPLMDIGTEWTFQFPPMGKDAEPESSLFCVAMFFLVALSPVVHQSAGNEGSSSSIPEKAPIPQLDFWTTQATICENSHLPGESRQYGWCGQ